MIELENLLDQGGSEVGVLRDQVVKIRLLGYLDIPVAAFRRPQWLVVRILVTLSYVSVFLESTLVFFPNILVITVLDLIAVFFLLELGFLLLVGLFLGDEDAAVIGKAVAIWKVNVDYCQSSNSYL